MTRVAQRSRAAAMRPAAAATRLRLRGGFPLSYVARNLGESMRWRRAKVGASWEGFCVEAADSKARRAAGRDLLWSTHGGAKLDLLIVRGWEQGGLEIERTTAPSVTPSMRIGREDFELDSLDVIHTGTETFPLATGIRAVAYERILSGVRPLRRS